MLGGGIHFTASSKSENYYLLANIVDGDNGIEREVISRAKILVYPVYMRQKNSSHTKPFAVLLVGQLYTVRLLHSLSLIYTHLLKSFNASACSVHGCIVAIFFYLRESGLTYCSFSVFIPFSFCSCVSRFL